MNADRFHGYACHRSVWLQVVLAAIVVGPLLAQAPPAEEPKREKEAAKEPAPAFIRLLRNDDGRPLALQTAIAQFKPAGGQPPGLRVDLIGAMHIGDESYYQELNRRFKRYDAVLYELVAPEKANVPKPGRSPDGFIGGVQVGMKSLLDLAFQLDHIDYRAKNMVHADMDPEEFNTSMEKRGESWIGMFFRSMGQAYAQQANDPFGFGDWRLIAAMFAEDRAYQLKLVLAEEFAHMKGQLEMLDGPEGSTIITERNKKALAVLRREIDQGKRKLAVFYGAGHLPDMQQRLEQDFGLQRVNTEWLTAWSLEKKTQQAESAQQEKE